MAWGYSIWDNANNKLADSSDNTLFPTQSYPGVDYYTSSTTTVYDISDIGTSDIHFTANLRRFPSGTHKKEMAFTSINFGESYSSVYPNITKTVSFATYDTMIKDTGCDIDNWKTDAEIVSQLVLLPITHIF